MDAIELAYQRAFGRPATPAERARAGVFVSAHGLPAFCRALLNAKEVDEALEGTADFTATLFRHVKEGVAKGGSLQAIYDDTMARMRPRFGNWVIFEHCMPFNVSRAYDEAKGIDTPRIWTAERDVEMWKALEKRTKDGEIA